MVQYYILIFSTEWSLFIVSMKTQREWISNFFLCVIIMGYDAPVQCLIDESISST